MGPGLASRYPEEAGSPVKAACTRDFEAWPCWQEQLVTVAGYQPLGFLKVQEREKPV